eukprot:3712387-Prymnesium_polylepis.2
MRELRLMEHGIAEYKERYAREHGWRPGAPTPTPIYDGMPTASRGKELSASELLDRPQGRRALLDL